MRSFLAAGAVLALCALALSGCLSAGKGPASSSATASHLTQTNPVRLPDPGKDFSHVVVTDHGAPELHTVRALHGGSFGLDLVGYDTLTEKQQPGAVGTGWGAGGIWTTYACVAQWLGTGGLALVDIKDPAHPTVVSQVDDPLVNGDCQFTEDGNYLFAGAYLSATGTAGVENDPSCQPLFNDGCPGGGGINVWDTHDKANPKHLLFSNTGQYHTLQVHTDPATNVTYVVQAYTGDIYRFDPKTPALDLVATITPMDHDMWIDQHPITHQWLLYSGAGKGFVIYNFTDPSNPSEIAQWQPDDAQANQSAEGCCAWHRQAQVEQVIDGKALVVVAGEDCGGGNGLPYFVIDITDVTKPSLVSSFEVPGHLKADSNARHLCEFTTHEFSVFDGYVITANYHAGAWLFDIGSPERLYHPVTLGYYIPANEPLTSDPVFGSQDLTWPWNPFVWGAYFDSRGYALVGDFSSGLYVLKVPGVTHEA